LTIWHDGEIQAGQDWDTEIKDNLAAATIVILLVSRHFNASKYIADVELPPILERRTKGTVEIIPIIVSAIHLSSTALGDIQCIPVDELQRLKPINEWQPVDPAWAQIDQKIRRVLGDSPPTIPIAPPPTTPINTPSTTEMDKLNELKLSLKLLVAKNIQEALDAIKNILLPTSNLYNTYIQLQARYSRNREDAMLGVKNQQAVDLENAKITHAIQWLIDEIGPSDLKK